MSDIKRKAAFHNLGCKVNSYETDAMVQSLRENGYEIVPFEPGADVYIINTCTVTNIADRKSRQMLHRAKKMNPDAVVVAAGCYVQAVGEELLQDEAVDIIIGNNKKGKLAEILEHYFEENDGGGRQKLEETLAYSELCEYENMSIKAVTEHTRAFIKIQDGCNQFCTYCIIPYSRGRIRSRRSEEIVREVRDLAENGYREIVLTGIHLSSYGRDSGEDVDLLSIVQKLGKIEGIERIRLGSLEQGVITDEFLSGLRAVKQFCPHFHLSLQSGCEATLRRMNRRYTPVEYLHKCELIRQYFDRPAITTDVIAGFPGETEEEFDETCQFLKKAEFSELHIFKYSKRKGTKAASMDNQVDDAVKAERSGKLIKLGENMKIQYMESYIGADKDILFEERVSIGGREYFVGHTKEYIKTAVSSNDDLSGRIVRVKIKTLLNKEILLAQLDEIY